MYRELLIFPEALKGKPMFPDTARSMVAKACDGSRVSPEIFSRQPEDGKSMQRVFGHTADGEGFGAVPGVCFGGGNGFVRLYGLGKRGVKLLSENAGDIATAISALHGNCPYRFVINDGACQIGNPDGSTFRIRNLIVSKKRDHFSDIAANGLPTLAAMEPLIKKAILRGLIGQAMTIDEETGSNLAGAIKTDEAMDIRIFDGKPVFIPLKSGLKTCALGVHGLMFTMNGSISGPWFVGHLRSRGFGLIEKGRIQS